MGCVCVENRVTKFNEELRYFWKSLKISKLSTVDIYSIFSHKKRKHCDISLDKWEALIKNLFLSDDFQYKKFTLEFWPKQIAKFKQNGLEDHFILALLLFAKSNQDTISADVIKMSKLCSIEINENDCIMKKDLKGILMCLCQCCINEELIKEVCSNNFVLFQKGDDDNNNNKKDYINEKIELFINDVLDIDGMNKDEKALNDIIDLKEFFLNNYSLLHNIGDLLDYIFKDAEQKHGGMVI